MNEELEQHIENEITKYANAYTKHECGNPICVCHDKKVDVTRRQDKPACFVANGILVCRCNTCKLEDYALPQDMLDNLTLLSKELFKQEETNPCGKPHNNGEDTCNECLTIKEGI